MRSSLRANSSIGKKRGKKSLSGQNSIRSIRLSNVVIKNVINIPKKTKHFSGNSPVFLIAWFLAAVWEKNWYKNQIKQIPT